MNLLQTIARLALATSVLCTALLLGSDANADPGAPANEPVLAAPGDGQPPPPSLPPAANPSSPPAPTPAARTATPVEPGSAAAPAARDPGTSAQPATPAPTYVGGPPVARPPVAPAVKKYATRGVFELGGTFGLTFHEDKDGPSNTKDVYLGGNIFMNIFVTRFFYLGPRVNLGFSQSDTEEEDYWSISFGFSFAPGVAFPMGSKAFVFVELSGGFGYYYSKISNLEIIRGSVGGEVGFKFLLGKSYLMRISLNPIYYVGDIKADMAEPGDVKDFYLLISLGFSGFM